ncbi:hypothetical protein OQA88_2331 [Cercophora sp. LCS_1]
MSSLLCCFGSKPKPKPSTPDTPAPDPSSLLTTFLTSPAQALQTQLESQLQAHPSTIIPLLKASSSAIPTTPPPPTTSSLSPLPPLVPPPLTDADADWANSIGEQRCTPLQKTKPATLQALIAIINDARSKSLRVRAIGSGHAFSSVARTDGAVLVNPVLLNDVRAVDATVLKNGVIKPGKTLLRVQAGITTRALKLELGNRGLALPNQGGYDGQTVSGTLATGTHGSGITWGPLASMARAIVVVTEMGEVVQVESGEGITSVWGGTVDGVPAKLRQEGEVWRALLTGMGCFGVVYEFVLEVVDAFKIKEVRSSTTWEEVRKELVPELWKPVAPLVGGVDHFELVLNPYTRWFRNACVKVERTRVPQSTKSEGQRQDWLEVLLEQVAIQKAPELVAFLTKIPFVSPLVIDQAIMTLVYDGPYVDNSYNIFSLGAANEIKGMALELHCDATQCVPTIDKLLKVFQEQALKYMWYMAGPLGIRFVAASDAYLAPQAGRMTCTIELAMLVGLKTGKDLAKQVKERMCTNESTSVRVHWGLDLDFVTAQDVRAWYPNFEKWHDVYRDFNSTGMFNNKFTDRLGISV